MSSPPITICITKSSGDVTPSSSNSHDSDMRSPPLHDRLHHLTLRKKTSYRKAVCGTHAHLKHAEITSKKRELKDSVDWTENALLSDHIWLDTHKSGDLCFMPETNCTKRGPRKKCASCKIIAHAACAEQMTMSCRPSFREATLRSYRDDTVMKHHWVHRLRVEGRCRSCLKGFQQKFSFQNKFVAISCSWCKEAYHADGCFSMDRIGEQCLLGQHANLIVPPHWIIRLAKKNSFRSSVRKRRRSSIRRRESNVSSREEHLLATTRPFLIKPVPSPQARPLLVFINPRSGGNQGSRLMHKLQWLLNPRQVFDLAVSGPRAGLELFGKMPNLRILACGGDGTVGWILSVIDSMGITPHPPVAILPLGTGNDLARTLNWGGGYTDEPLSKILTAVEDGSVVNLDRWSLQVKRLAHSLSSISDSASGEESSDILPLEVMNNYFSLGADAHVTLEFHESREANPEKFSSRFWNKMYYAGVGGKDILKRPWKDLSEHITLECDGQDLTSKIRETKFHCLLFLNITKYAAGTTPWGSATGTFQQQRYDDGLLEVIGFTTASLAGLQIGAHTGVRLTQCRTAHLTTAKTIPVQVDGEPCRLHPSDIFITRHNQAAMVLRPKRGSTPLSPSLPDLCSQSSHASSQHMKCNVFCIGVNEYEALHYDKEQLRKMSKLMGSILVDHSADLIQVRHHIEKLFEEIARKTKAAIYCPSSHWSFIDSTAERFFRVDRTQEHLYYAMDIFTDDLFIVCPAVQAPVDSVPHTAMTSSYSVPERRWSYLDDYSSPVMEGQRRSTLSGDATFHQPLRRANAKKMHSALTSTAETSSLAENINKLSKADVKGNIDVLVKACRLGEIQQVTELIESGADFLETDRFGLTCLHHAAICGHLHVAAYLIENGPRRLLDIVERDKGQTALHKAAFHLNSEVCHLLVDAGASRNVKDFNDKTASELALEAGDQDLAGFLKQDESHVSSVPKLVLETDL